MSDLNQAQITMLIHIHRRGRRHYGNLNGNTFGALERRGLLDYNGRNWGLSRKGRQTVEEICQDSTTESLRRRIADLEAINKRMAKEFSRAKRLTEEFSRANSP